MVSIRPNQACIGGTVKGKCVGPEGYLQLELQLASSDDVDSMPNMARADVGNIILVNYKQDQLPSCDTEEGKFINLTVRKAPGQQYFVVDTNI